MSRSPSQEVMNIGGIMEKNRAAAAAAAVAAAAANAAQAQHAVEQPNHAHLQLHSTGADRARSPHGSESSYHSGPPVSSGFEWTDLSRSGDFNKPTARWSPSSMLVPDPNTSGMMMPGLPALSQGMNTAMPIPSYNTGNNDKSKPGAPTEAREPPPKAYPCSTCGKGFARRSDLARHERIHSGHRPHVCEFPSCGKQFIQRSALTVHMRVHTGEKPHMCERCGKPFSDSSSLARHRRIHLGTRPYKCPFADCQKTFTRRTTLTRHQNSHTGTVEEAAAATAAALAAQASKNAAGVARSDGEARSSHGSPLNTPSPGHRQMSMSPSADLATAGAMRQNDYSYMGNGSLPVHIRTDMQGGQSPTSAPTYNGGGMRPTSHPYPPPPTLEPNVEPHQSQAGSAGGSPHMGSVGWQSPSHMPSPTHSNSGNSYVYPDPDPSFATNGLGQMYYTGGPSIRRPTSTEPLSSTYDVKPRPNELWAGAQ